MDNQESAVGDVIKELMEKVESLDISNGDRNTDLESSLNEPIPKHSSSVMDCTSSPLAAPINDLAANDVPADFDKSEAGSDVEESPEDVTEDKEHRMEAEKDLSEEEKQKRKEESLQLKLQGNKKFSEDDFTAAIDHYSQALQICPLCYTKERSVLYANRGACFQKLDKSEKAISDCTEALELQPEYVKPRQRRAVLYEASDKLDEALNDYKKVLEYEPCNQDALFAAKILPERIHDRNEKLKTEMFGKLKELGNVILRPFGLSTENFQLQQNPDSGGYSINFQQNK